MTTPAVTIAARTDSRWRCGVEHTSTPQPWPAGHWTDDQLEQMRADPMLTVIESDAVPAADDTGGLRTTPTIQAALDMALSALRNATPDEALRFVERMRDDPQIGPKVTAAAEAALPGAGKDAPSRAGRILAAVEALDLADSNNLTKDGKPTVEALESALDFDITAAERDEAWAAWQDD